MRLILILRSMVTPSDEVSYGDHPLQKVKSFRFSPSNEHTLLLVHGGAWRDPSNTYMDFNEMVGRLGTEFPTTAFNVIGINYRLSPEVKHPEHLRDVVSAIEKVQRDVGVRKVHLVGHSVGATLLLQLLNYQKMLQGIKNVPLLDIEIQTLFFVDGIYDMVDLIDEYGASYRLFVENAFETEDDYVNGSQMTWRGKEPFEFEGIQVVVVMSRQDELLSLRQTQKFLKFLEQRGITSEYLEQDWGLHEEVYRRNELADTIGRRLSNA